MRRPGGRPAGVTAGCHAPAGCRAPRRSPTSRSEPGVSRQTVSNALNNPDLLRPDTLGAGAGGDRRARLLAQPGRPQPAHPRLAPDRAARRPRREDTANALMDRFVHSLVETSREAGYHVLLFAGRRATRTPLDGYDDLLRSAAVDAFVVTDTYLGNPQAAWLDERRAPFVAFGRPWDDPDAAAPVGRRRRRAPGAELAIDHLVERGHQPDRLDRLAEGLAASARTGARGWAGPMHEHGLPTSRLASRGRRHRRSSAARPRACCSTRPQPDRVRLRLATPWRWACCTPSPSAGCAPGRDVAVVGFDDSQVAAQVVHPRPDLGAAAARAGRGRGRALRSASCSAHPPDPPSRACCSPRRSASARRS